MLSQQKTVDSGENHENHGNRVKTPALKRPLDSSHSGGNAEHRATPLTARKGLRDVTNSVQKSLSSTLPLSSSSLRPSKLSRVFNEDDIPEPEHASIMTAEEEASAYQRTGCDDNTLLETFADIPVAYDFASIMHPFKRPGLVRPHEGLSTRNLGQLYRDIAAKGREQERIDLEEAIQSLDKFNVGDFVGGGVGGNMGIAPYGVDGVDELLGLDVSAEIEVTSDPDEHH